MGLKQISQIFSINSILVFISYFLTARAGLALEPVGGFATLVWPPTGIALASVLIFGRSVLPSIFLAAFLVNFSVGAHFLLALAMGFGNMLESLVASLLLQKIIDFRNSLDRLKDALGLIIYAALLSTLVSATIGTGSLYLAGVVKDANFQSAWLAWWIGDVLGDLVVAPLILVWSANFRLKLSFRKTVELLIIAVYLLFSAFIVFTNISGIDTRSAPITYLVFPPLIWLSLRFGQTEVVFFNFLLSIFAIVCTFLGLGPFVINSLSNSLLYLQTFMALITSTTLIIAAITTEKNNLASRKDEFISLASHELKTPLTAISGYNQLLIGKIGKKNKQLYNYLTSSNLQISKLTHLINNLLDLSRIHSNRLEIIKEYFLLDQLISEIVSNFKAVNRSHEIILKGDFKQKIYADKNALGMVLLNLINNSVKYSPKSKKIIIAAKSSRDGITLSVQDFGIGIDKKYQDKIFDRFYRITSEDTKHTSGLGLGLYLSANIIKEHNGKIWFKSHPKKSTTFFISLPHRI